MIWTSTDWSVVKHCIALGFCQELFLGHPVSFRLEYWETASIFKQGHFHTEIWYFLWGCFSLATSMRSFVWFAFVGLCFRFSFSYFISWKIDYINGTTSNAQIKWAQTKQTGGYVETKKTLSYKRMVYLGKNTFSNAIGLSQTKYTYISSRLKYRETASISKQGNIEVEIWHFLWGCLSLATPIISVVCFSFTV